MRNHSKFVTAALCLIAACANAQVTLQNFSSVVGSSTFFYGTWEATGSTLGSTSPNAQFSQGSDVYNITGSSPIVPTNSDASAVEFFYPQNSPISIGTNSLLSVTAQTLSGNVASSFVVILFDTAQKSAKASFALSSFPTGNYATASASLTFQTGFNTNSIESLRISGGQPEGIDRFNVSFDNIAAVPEPVAYAVIVGVTCLAVARIVRRRGLFSAQSE